PTIDNPTLETPADTLLGVVLMIRGPASTEAKSAQASDGSDKDTSLMKRNAELNDSITIVLDVGRWLVLVKVVGTCVPLNRTTAPDTKPVPTIDNPTLETPADTLLGVVLMIRGSASTKAGVANASHSSDKNTNLLEINAELNDLVTILL